MGYLLLDMDRVENIQPKIAIDKIEVKDNLQNISSIPLLDIFELDFERKQHTILLHGHKLPKTSTGQVSSIGLKVMIFFGAHGLNPQMFHTQIYPVDPICFQFDQELEIKAQK